MECFSVQELLMNKGSCCRDRHGWPNSYGPASRWVCKHRVAMGVRSSEESGVSACIFAY